MMDLGKFDEEKYKKLVEEENFRNGKLKALPSLLDKEKITIEDAAEELGASLKEAEEMIADYRLTNNIIQTAQVADRIAKEQMRHDRDKLEATFYYIKRIAVKAEVTQEELNAVLLNGEPDYIRKQAEELDRSSSEKLEFDYWEKE